MTDRPIHGTPTILGPHNYNILHNVMTPQTSPSLLTRIQLESRGSLQVGISILGDMHFKMIVADDSKVYNMDPIYNSTTYPRALMHYARDYQVGHKALIRNRTHAHLCTARHREMWIPGPIPYGCIDEIRTHQGWKLATVHEGAPDE